MNIVFLTRSLNYGGAERQLVELVKGLKKSGHNVSIGVFYPGGPLIEELQKAEIRIENLDKKNRWDIVGFVSKLKKFIRDENPEIVHGYLVVPNIMCTLLKLISPRIKIVWGVRSSNLEFSQYDWLTRATFLLSSLLSCSAARIILNSKSGLEYHRKKGYPIKKMVVIPNGIDTQKYNSNDNYRKKIREEYHIKDSECFIGLVGRLDPMKDHTTFLHAAALFLRQNKNVKFICVGNGKEEYKNKLHDLCGQLLLQDHVIWAGTKDNTNEIYNAFDINTLCSVGEGFPNVVGEAMACGIRCVVTDVGDAREIVNELGYVVPVRDPSKLSQAWMECLNDEKLFATAIRQRIIDYYSIDKLVTRTEDVLARLKLE